MRQHGVVTLAQMHGAGISPRQVERGLERGDLVRLHRGVYRLGPVSPPHCPEMAATLACGANAVLSHRSAAAMYEILDPHQARSTSRSRTDTAAGTPESSSMRRPRSVRTRSASAEASR